MNKSTYKDPQVLSDHISTVEQTGASKTTVFRPFQYLGSKLRSLDAIAEIAENLVGNGARVLDPFCGSTVVAQRLADLGMQVHASDALNFCASAARATLGVQRGNDGIDQILAVLETPTPTWGLEDWISREQQAIDEGNGMRLIEVSCSVPQMWRGHGAPDPNEALVASHYAGTYFGVSQALRIDAIRKAIQPLTGWNRDVALTALISAMSACAFSAGKHFAQPHKTSSDKDLRFHARRALSDRAVNVDEKFRTAVFAIADRSGRGSDGHSGTNALVEDLPDSPPVDLIYADPPYTAQQYSRFYHVPEIVYNYTRPALQIHRGKITSGLYPKHRYKSDYCSKRKSGNAFRSLAALAMARRAELLLSYSRGRTNTGNDRMISIDDLVALLRDYGPVSMIKLDHDYRQFNRTESSMDDHSDPEFLIHCRVRPC